MNPRVAIIVLNYNNYSDTISCLNSIKNINYDNYFVVVVDNASTNESVEELKKFINNNRQICFINSDVNLGYAGGNNIGIKYALKNEAEYICILNNDTIVEPDFLSNLVEYMLNHKSCGVCGPAILEFHNKEIIQSTGGKIHFNKGEVESLNYGLKYCDVENEVYCDYVGGACMLIPREIIDVVGFIPEDYFLFFEETDWCVTIKKLGYSIVCYTKSRVWHKGSASINKVKGLSRYLMERNRMYFIKKNSTRLKTIKSFFYLAVKSIYRGIFSDSENFMDIISYIHGLIGKISSKYDFIRINIKGEE